MITVKQIDRAIARLQNEEGLQSPHRAEMLIYASTPRCHIERWARTAWFHIERAYFICEDYAAAAFKRIARCAGFGRPSPEASVLPSPPPEEETISAARLEIAVRNARKLEYVPALGIEVYVYDLGDIDRILSSDLIEQLRAIRASLLQQGAVS